MRGAALRETMSKEADAWFIRNREALAQGECSIGMKIFSDFYDNCHKKIRIERVLEVGCSTGRNLMYMKRKYGMECYGIDPSEKALQYGKEQTRIEGMDIKLTKGYSDELPYEDDFFDMIYFGFCLYQIDRNLLFRTFAEMDRKLRRGGYASLRILTLLSRIPASIFTTPMYRHISATI